jgi:hypothetical protein
MEVTALLPPPPEGIRSTVFIALGNPSLSAGFEPVNLRSNGKKDNHYTTEDDSRLSNSILMRLIALIVTVVLTTTFGPKKGAGGKLRNMRLNILH